MYVACLRLHASDDRGAWWLETPRAGGYRNMGSIGQTAQDLSIYLSTVDLDPNLPL